MTVTSDQLRQRLLDLSHLLGPEPIPRAWLVQLLLRDQGFLARQAAIGPGPHTEAVDAAIENGELVPTNESHSLLTLATELNEPQANRISANPELRKLLWTAITRFTTERSREMARTPHNPRNESDALRLLPLIRRLATEEFPLVAFAAANTLLSTLLAHELLDEGEKLFAFLVEEKKLASEAPRAAGAAMNLGVIRQQMKHPQARETWERALQAAEAAFNPSHISISRCHAALAEVLSHAKEQQLAEQHIWQALSIARRGLPENHIKMAALYLSDAVVHYGCGKYEEAIETARRSASIVEKSPNPNVEFHSRVYLFLATVYVKQKDFASAREPAEKSFSIRAEQLSELHPGLKTYHNMLAIIYRALQEFSDARRHYEFVIAIETKQLPLNHPSLIGHHFLLATILEKMEDRVAERAQLEKTIALIAAQPTPDATKLASLHHKYAVNLSRGQQFIESLDHYRKCIDLHEKHKHAKPLETAAAAWNAAQTAHLAKNFCDMRFFLEKVRAIYEKELPPDDQRLNRLRFSFAALQAIEKSLDALEKSRKEFIAKKIATLATASSKEPTEGLPRPPDEDGHSVPEMGGPASEEG
jgi:tetratricopeptide (TPR) repeat protein